MNFIPNSFQTPNYIIDILQDYLTPEEQVVLFRMLRELIGWRVKEGETTVPKMTGFVSLRTIAYGKTRTMKDGSVKQIMGGCGITNLSTISDALAALVDYGILIEGVKNRRKGTEYTIVIESDNYNWELLKARREERYVANRSRTASARNKLHRRRAREDKPASIQKLFPGGYEGWESHIAHLMTISRVGEGLAKTLLEYLGPTYADFLLSPDAGEKLEQMDGIGRGTARRVVREFPSIADKIPVENSSKSSKRDDHFSQTLEIIQRQGNLNVSEGDLSKEYTFLKKYSLIDIEGVIKFMQTKLFYQKAPITPKMIRLEIDPWIKAERPPSANNSGDGFFNAGGDEKTLAHNNGVSSVYQDRLAQLGVA